MGVRGETGSIWRLVSLIVFVKERLARVLVPHEVCGWKWYESLLLVSSLLVTRKTGGELSSPCKGRHDKGSVVSDYLVSEKLIGKWSSSSMARWVE